VPDITDPELQARVTQVLAPAYEVEGEIGRGGNGIVYRARDVRLKRNVAVKLLPPELAYRAEIRTRFLQEAQTAAQLSHPNIVPIYTVDEKDGLVYFVMAFIDGESLGGRLRARGPTNADDTRRILREVGQALAYAHGRGVIHRDIKPDNILIGSDGRALVTDFGIARAMDETTGSGTRLTATGMAIGTPAYMSPEQCAGDRTIDGRSDLYSLGVVGYQMLTGVPPFTGASTPALLIKQISEAPVPVRERRADIPDDLARVIMVMLAKAPSDRFADATAFVAALDGGPVPATPPPVTAAGTGAAPPPAVSSVPAMVFSDSDIARWNAPAVQKFRRRFTPFVLINGVIVLVSVFTGENFLGVTAVWSVLMAYWYAKLWADGFDWRDVFKQPRDRLFFDVAADAIDDARAIFDKNARAGVRERERQRALQIRMTDEYRGSGTVPPPRVAGGSAVPAPSTSGSVPTGTRPAAPIAGGSQGRAGDPADALRQRAREQRQAERTAAGVPSRPPAPVRPGGDGARPSANGPPPPRGAGAAGGAFADGSPAQEAAKLVGPAVLAGPHGALVRRAVEDRSAVRDIVGKLGAADRALLPDVVQTVDGLVDRIASLATALERLDGDVIPDPLPAIDARIAATSAETPSAEQERKLTLLKRQRATLKDLADRRTLLFGQLENAALLMQNVRFDLLKLRSAGVQSAIDDVTSATQEARALSREIGNVLNVAAELKAI